MSEQHDPPGLPRFVLPGIEAITLVRRMFLGALIVSVAFGVIAAALAWLVPASGPRIPGGPAAPALTLLAMAQLATLVAAGVAGVNLARILRGTDPAPLVTPTHQIIRRIGYGQLVAVLAGTVAWLVVAPGVWVLTVSLALVSAQAGVALVFLARHTASRAEQALRQVHPRR